MDIFDSTVYSSIKLATSQTRAEEKIQKEALQSNGYLCAVTEITGKSSAIEEKLYKSTIASATNNQVISRSKKEISCLIHALKDAAGRISDDENDKWLKIAIIRDEEKIVITVFGSIAMHNLIIKPFIGIGMIYL